MAMKRLIGLMLLASNCFAQPTVKCRFELQGNVIFVKGSIGKAKALDLVLDSGSAHTSFDESLATSLNWDLSLKALSATPNGEQELSVIKDLDIELCGKPVTEATVMVYPLGFLSKAVKRRVDGIIGIELFRRVVVAIDYPTQTLQLIEPDSFVYAGPGEPLPVSYNRRLPIVTGSVTPFGGQPIPVKLMVDSGGSAVNADFSKAFGATTGLISGMIEARDSKVTIFRGDTSSKIGKVQDLRIGNVSVSEPEVEILEYQTADPKVMDGTLGSGFLKQFKVIFDLPHDRIIFERQ
jgi:hypothetical protein